MSKYVTVDIAKDGSVKIEAHGFDGCGCTTATEQLELVLGGAAAQKKDPKPEFYNPSESEQIKGKLTF